jgi:Fe-S cluster biogenesis protein NfuA/nitrite reductase/ring-hydroxylating ferredoxin subunit
MAAHAHLLEDRDLQKRLAHIDVLVGELQQLPDPASRAMVEELLSTVLDLHGEALSRMLDTLGERGDPAADKLLSSMAGDDVIRGVLLLHGLHPIDLRTRVEGALESVRPYMRSHGGGVELVDVVGDTVRIRLEGHCKGCPSSAMTLKLAVEKAIFEAAPDVAAIDVDAPEEAAPAGPPGFDGLVSLPMMAPGGAPKKAAAAQAVSMGEWSTVGVRSSDLPNGAVIATTVDKAPVLIARVSDVFYAYVATCPTCRDTMRGATMEDTALTCGGCGTRYDVRGAGQGIDSEQRIEPLPLLEDGGALRIAIPAGIA